MNKRRKFILIGLLLVCIISVYARGNKEEEPKPNIVQVTGVVRLVGSHPFYELVVTGDGAEWYIARDEMNKLHDLQHRTVTIEGEEIVSETRTASDNPFRISLTRRTLSNVRIIEVSSSVRGFD